MFNGMGNASTGASTGPTNGGFFGSILSDISEGIGRIATDVLPNWVGRELGKQEDDMLRRDLYDEDPDRVNIDKQRSTEKGSLIPISLLNRTLFDVGSISVTGSTVLMVAGIAIVGILAIKYVR